MPVPVTEMTASKDELQAKIQAHEQLILAQKQRALVLENKHEKAMKSTGKRGGLQTTKSDSQPNPNPTDTSHTATVVHTPPPPPSLPPLPQPPAVHREIPHPIIHATHLQPSRPTLNRHSHPRWQKNKPCPFAVAVPYP